MLHYFHFFPFSALFVFVSQALAGDAFFSPDGKTVTLSVMFPSSMTGLVNVDISTGKASQLQLPAELVDGDIESIARGAEGEILFLAKESVWVLKTGEAAKKVTAIAPTKVGSGLFVGTVAGQPTADWLFVSGKESEESLAGPSFYGRKPGAKEFSQIFCRRVDDAENGSISADGRLFFISSGDLWEGSIQTVDDGEVAGILIGSRILSLSLLNTDGGNGGSLWLDRVNPAGKWIYCALRGRHEAAIVRAPMPEKPVYASEDQDIPSLKETYTAQARALAETEIISEGLCDIYGFCATEVDGKPLVFYYTRPLEGDQGPALMLWNGSGEPKQIGQLPRAKDE